METLQNADNTVFFSQVSLYEIAIKQAIGKLPDFNSGIREIYEQAVADGFSFLDIKNQHIDNYNTVPFLRNIAILLTGCYCQLPIKKTLLS